MIQRLFFQTIVFSVALCLALSAEAEVSCTMTMSYEWQPAQEVTGAGDAKDSKMMKDSSMKSQKRMEFVRRLQETGEQEAAVIRALKDKAFLLKRDVMRECAAIHENHARCIASRYRSYSSDIRTGGFRARKALEEAIQLDCMRLRGQCLHVVMSDPACEDLSAKAEKGSKDSPKEKEKEKEKDKK